MSVPNPATDRAVLAQALLDHLLAEEGLERAPAPVIPANPNAASAPLSFSQEILWLLDQSTPGLVAYNGPIARQLDGPVDADLIERALEALVARHPALRTTFRQGADGAAEQVVGAPGPFRMEREDLRPLPADDRASSLRTRMTVAARKPFDLRRDLLLRAWLFRVSDSRHVLLLVSHHIVLDGWSVGILLRELSEAYAAQLARREPRWAPLPLSFGDYATWQRSAGASAAMGKHLDWWLQALSGPHAALDVPTDGGRQAAQRFDGATARHVVPRDVLDQVRRLGQAHGASVYMCAVALWQAVLHRWSGQPEVLLGSPSAGRSTPGVEGVVGYFNNPLVLRGGFRDDPTVETHLQRVRDYCIGAYEHQDLPYERLVVELQQREPGLPAPLFRCVLTMQDAQATDLALDGVSITPLPVDHGTVKFDLTLLTSEHDDGLHFDLEYRTDLFQPATAARLLGHLEQLLRGAVAEPTQRMSAVPLLTAAEAAALAAWEGPGVAFPATPVAARLAARAAATPTAPAVVSGATTLAYGALQRRATALAQALGAAGVGPGDRVGLLLEREAELLVGVQGIWLAGAGYVPLVPDLPPARRAALVAESGARVVVTTAALRERVPAGVAVVWVETAQTPTAAAVPGARPEALAYVLFTSGSTGVPKGVAVTHAQLAHYVEAISARLGLALDGSTPWTSASVSTLAADLGHTAVFPFLAAGGTVHLLPTAVAMEPAPWAAYSAAHRLDLLKIAPSHLKALVGDATGPALAALLPTRWLVVGGEPCPLPFAAALRAAGPCRVLNHYGPTETTVGACTYAPDEEPTPAETMGSLPIGRPLPNLRAEVRSAHGPVQPLGVPGELWVGGPQVAQGYLGRPDLTAERFTTDAAGRRWYRTGDRVRRLSTGALEFLGRLDAQVKVRGHRVELEEVERVLAAVPGVTQAAVRLHEDALAAYLVAAAPVTDAQLLQAAQAALPDYMVPSTWTRLPRLPLNANGKLDRAQLPAPEAAGPADGDGAAPQGPVEIQLAQLWAEVLKQDGLGRDANFFTLGGHSLLAIRLLGKLSKTFGVRLALRQLFEAPTIAQLAVVIERQGSGEGRNS